jgi:hypothetical protein
MRGAITPFPNTPSWCGAQLKRRDNFAFTFTLPLEVPKEMKDPECYKVVFVSCDLCNIT